MVNFTINTFYIEELMRKFLSFSLSIFSLLILAPLAAETIGGVTYTLPADGKKWKIGQEFKSENGTTRIYILDNEEKDNWTESFGVNSNSKPGETAEEFEKALPKIIESFYPGKEFTYKILDSNSEGILAEWSIKGGPKDSSHSWMRCINKKDGSVCLQYTTRKIDQVEQARKEWMAVLQQAKLAD